jgi:hypothetical protein
MQSILDPTFRYTSSANTDIRRRFAGIRREQRKRDETAAADATAAKVLALQARRVGSAP